MKSFLLSGLAIVVLAACTDTDSKVAEVVNADSAAASKNYFPVNAFINNEISYADTFFTTFIKYNITETKTDSSFIKPEEFKQLASEFATNDLSKEALEKDYTETSFNDQTTGKATFTYSTHNDSLAVKRVDVLAVPGEGFDKISSIYIEKITNSGDTTFRKKVYWKSHKNFQVITEVTIRSQLYRIDRLKIVWDASE